VSIYGRGQRIVIAAEDPAEDYYDAPASRCILEIATELGCQASLLPCPVISGPESLPSSIIKAMEEADHVIFQARAGDQVRFTKLAGTAAATTLPARSPGRSSMPPSSSTARCIGIEDISHFSIVQTFSGCPWLLPHWIPPTGNKSTVRLI
jgi:hypothetical protein